MNKFLSAKLTITVDYGEMKKTRIKDENGKVKTFNSMIDGLNYMSEDGWEFVQAYVITVMNQNVYHYLLRKKNSETVDK